MKIGDHLFFAPNVRFADLDVNSVDVLQHFYARIEGFYLAPARLLADQRHDFAAVLLLGSSMDALARYASAPARNRDRYIEWLKSALPCLSTQRDAEQFYDDFRCGLVHEARAKHGCVFTSDTADPIVVQNEIMAVNPRLLVDEVQQALVNFCKTTAANPTALSKFQLSLKNDFTHELRSR